MSSRAIVHIGIPANNRHESGHFYSKLFGWRFEHFDEAHYSFFYTPSLIGGLRELGWQQIKPGDILVYVESEDVNADLARAATLGGSIALSKTEIPTVGWYGIFKDPFGNMIAPITEHKKSYTSNTMQMTLGAICMVQFSVDDRYRAADFYAEMFSWEVTHHDAYDYSTFTTGSIDGGLGSMSDPANKKGETLVYLLSSDVEVDLAKAVALGATIALPKANFPGGTFSILADPTGNRIALVKFDR